ncbi:MAG: PqqD family protein [Desulfobacteraceae bacterium]|nr:PqqD family protein [Desulfobacteraceae bacterium]
MKIDIKRCYCISDNVIAKEIEGELVIVPMIADVGNLDAEMYSLNSTGLAVWKQLDGEKDLEHVITALSEAFATTFDHIKDDVVEIVEQLLKKGLVFET